MSDGSLEWTSVVEYGALGGGPWACFQAPKGVGAREKKRIELQNRVYKARLIIPMHILFRVFEDPRECMEAEEIVKRLVFPS